MCACVSVCMHVHKPIYMCCFLAITYFLGSDSICFNKLLRALMGKTSAGCPLIDLNLINECD